MKFTGMTVNDFLNMAFDNTYDFSVCDLGKMGEIIYSSRVHGENFPDSTIGDMEFHSWELGKQEIIINVDSSNE